MTVRDSITHAEMKTMLHQADYIFENKVLLDAFNECLERAGTHNAHVKIDLDKNIKTRLAEPGEDLDFSGDNAFVVDESNADDMLEDILIAASVSDALIMMGKVHAESGDVRVPVVFFSEDFTVGDVDMAGERDDLCCLSISHSQAVETALKSVRDFNPSFDFWNDVLSPLCIDEEIEIRLDAAGIDPDNRDHTGGEQSGNLFYYDLYYHKYDQS
jgi:hypothetical protein